MDLNQLRVFYHAAKLKSFSLAAEALFVTRPLISIRIKQLEDAYDFKLFDISNIIRAFIELAKASSSSLSLA